MQIKIEEKQCFFTAFPQHKQIFDYATNIYWIFRDCTSCIAFGGCLYRFYRPLTLFNPYKKVSTTIGLGK